MRLRPREAVQEDMVGLLTETAGDRISSRITVWIIQSKKAHVQYFQQNNQLLQTYGHDEYHYLMLWDCQELMEGE
jgi:hypothetical protein